MKSSDRFRIKAPLRLLLLKTSIILVGTITVTVSAEQIVNGGFEQPPTNTYMQVISPNYTAIPGWTVSSGSVDVVNAVGNGFTAGPAAEGAQYLDLNGTSAGLISQTFPTVEGVAYKLSFAYANNYNPPTSLTVHVTVSDSAGPLFITNATHSTSVAGNLDWTAFTRLFIARQSSATLTFASQNDGNGGVFLDGVSVEPMVVPTLVISNAGNQSATLSWTTNAPLFHLASTASLTPPVQWTDLTNQPIVIGNSFTVSVPNIVGPKFFVLRVP